MINLTIVIGSTRPSRKGIVLAEWITKLAKESGQFNVKVLDLKIINLPFMDEQHHPRLKKYEHEHTKRWSSEVEGSDAFIFVSPEYNYGFAAPLKNAIDYLFHEWQYKPVGFVTYGGISGGIRALQMIKQVVTALNMMPLVEAVNVPDFTKQINKENQFEATDDQVKTANALFTALAHWSDAMQTLREKKHVVK
jgi:NAD(P)H-dependent FMN reductase